MATKYVDLLNGNDANNGSTFALRKKTLASAAAVAAAGDIIRVMGNPSTSSGTATWTKGSALVTLSSAKTQALYNDGAWTANTNVTCSAPTSSPAPKQGANSAQMTTSASFTSGKIAHFPTGAVLNLSAYQQISFWIRATAAIASGVLSFNLCSDTTGNTIVDTLPINVALNAGKWTCITVNKGSALGASIQSIRLTANSALASATIQVDNVLASKAPGSTDCLTLNTLISPDNSTWYHIQSINGTTIYLDAQESTGAGLAKGYQGSTASSTFYLLQPTEISIGTSSTAYAHSFSANGASGNPITISGGWNSTDMSSQIGWTTLDRRDWTASALNLTGTTGYITLEKFNFTRCNFPIGLVASAQGYSITNGSCAGSSSFSSMPTRAVIVNGMNFLNNFGTTALLNVPSSASYNADQKAWSITNTKIWGATVGGIKIPNNISSPAPAVVGCDVSGCGGMGFDIQSPCDFRNNTANNNAAPGMNFQGANKMVAYNLVARGNTTGEIQINGAVVEIFTLDTNTSGGSSVPQIFFPTNSAGEGTIYNWNQYNGSTPLATLTSRGNPVSGQTANNQVNSQKENGNAANNSIYSDFGVITTTGVVGQSGSGIAWKLTPNANAMASSPLSLNVGKIACPANAPTTIKFWAKNSAASGINARLRIPGGRYSGIGSPGVDVTSSNVAGTTYTQYSLSFMPTEDCVVDVFFDAWGSTTQNTIISGPVEVTQ